MPLWLRKKGKIDIEHLPPPVSDLSTANIGQDYRNSSSTEKQALLGALRQTRGNQTQAARLLGINRVTVWNRMRKYGIDLKKVLDGSSG